jgi:hypothetical protein
MQQALDKFWEESDADELGWLEQHELYVAALRALEEKPPPLPPSVGVPEKRWFK